MANPKKSDKEFAPLDLSFLDKGYYEGDILRPELLDKQAKSLGERFAQEKEQSQTSKKKVGLSKGQIRRFFGDVRELETRIERDAQGENIFESDQPQELDKHRALIGMLKSKAAYAAGRETVSRAFESFIVKSVDQIKTPKDFRAFVLFFEAIVGYYYGAGGE